MFKEETCGEKGIKLKEENYIDLTDDSEDENNINKNEINNIKINNHNNSTNKKKKLNINLYIITNIKNCL